jgi:beta-lactamase class A
MARTSTGLHRIEGRLPPGVKVANKTGSASGTTNDCGLIFLPGGAGTVALCVYVKACPLPAEEREGVIADLARTVYAHFMITA